LIRLDIAKHVNAMNIPGWKLHSLTGDLAWHYSITVLGNWRITFVFEDEDAVLVDYQDYHWEEPNMSRMYKPPHPGETLREDILMFG